MREAAAGMPGKSPARGQERIGRAFAPAVERSGLPAVVAVAATQDGLLYEGAFGYRDPAGAEPVTPDSLFRLRSMTKGITAAVCLQLVAEGRIGLDDPLGGVLPALAAPQVLEGFDATGQPILRPARRPLTLRHLLTHTSGFTYSIWSAALTRYLAVTGTPDLATGQRAALAVPLEFDPGDRWCYGIGIDWAGQVVEALCGQSLGAVLQTRLLGPLGMTDTTFRVPEAQAARLVTPHRRQPDGTLRPGSAPATPVVPEFDGGGGGLVSTPRDFLRFLQMLLNGGTLDGQRLLDPQSLSLLLTNQIGPLAVTRLETANPLAAHGFDQFPGVAHRWTMAFDLNEHAVPGGRSAGSVSWAGLMNSYFWLDPVRRVTGALFTQVQPFYDPGVIDLYTRFERAIYAVLDD